MPKPSSDDFQAFAVNFNLMGQNSSRKDLTSIIVTKSGLYAMRVEDPTKVLAFQQYMSDQANKDDFKARFDNSVITKAQRETTKKIDDQPGLTEQQQQAILDKEFEKWLARFILDFNTNTIDTGILLFHGDIHLSETTWTQQQTTIQP